MPIMELYRMQKVCQFPRINANNVLMLEYRSRLKSLRRAFRPLNGDVYIIPVCIVLNTIACSKYDTSTKGLNTWAIGSLSCQFWGHSWPVSHAVTIGLALVTLWRTGQTVTIRHTLVTLWLLGLPLVIPWLFGTLWSYYDSQVMGGAPVARE